jgi:hypothetical protein
VWGGGAVVGRVEGVVEAGPADRRLKAVLPDRRFRVGNPQEPAYTALDDATGDDAGVSSDRHGLPFLRDARRDGFPFRASRVFGTHSHAFRLAVRRHPAPCVRATPRRASSLQMATMYRVGWASDLWSTPASDPPFSYVPAAAVICETSAGFLGQRLVLLSVALGSRDAEAL